MPKIAKFILPALPPSLNSIYKINYISKQVYLDKSVKEFKSIVYPLIPQIKIPEGQALELKIRYYGMFLNKSDGKIKRKDGQNLDKVLYDIIFEKWGLDDSITFKGSWEKIHYPEKDLTEIEVYTTSIKKGYKNANQTDD